ncbi:MAG: permease-like cell division protein FtsX [Gammaproteobacteria bacterium]
MRDVSAGSDLPRSRRPTWIEKRLTGWALWHFQCLVYTLGQLANTPLNTLMIAAVIGIALALPAGLFVLLDNVQGLSRSWESAAQISVFLKPEVSDAEAAKLAKTLQARSDLAHVRVITREQAFQEYQQLSGFKDALAVLGDENPLPAVLVLQLMQGQTTPANIDPLLEALRQEPQVEIAQFDLDWLRRLHAIMEVIRRGVTVIGVLLGVGVLLIVGNTIRANVEKRREEIEVAKLLGATDAFIRRPFLYTGLWYGLLGGIVACLFVAVSLGLLQTPVRQLTALYRSDFSLSIMSADTLLTIWMVGAFLGVTGSWLAVGRHLAAIEPS